MTNKHGTLDSLYKSRMILGDTSEIKHRTYNEDSISYPWLTTLRFRDMDSMRNEIWLMEHSKQELRSAGFSEEEISGEVEFKEFVKRRRARNQTAAKVASQTFAFGRVVLTLQDDVASLKSSFQQP